MKKKKIKVRRAVHPELFRYFRKLTDYMQWLNSGREDEFRNFAVQIFPRKIVQKHRQAPRHVTTALAKQRGWRTDLGTRRESEREGKRERGRERASEGESESEREREKGRQPGEQAGEREREREGERERERASEGARESESERDRTGSNLESGLRTGEDDKGLPPFDCSGDTPFPACRDGMR